MALEDYKDVVATAASIMTTAQFFAGMFICKDIVKKGSTENVSGAPFIGGSAMGILMMQYSNILNDPAMTRVNIVGVTLNLGYLLCYYIYSENKRELQKQIFYTTAFVAALIAYVFWENPDFVEFRYGLIITTLFMLLIASPLLSLGDVIRTKSTEMLPFPLILSGTVVTFLWLLYGIIIKNSFIQFQNAVGFTLFSIQLSLFAIYPSRPQKKDKKKQ
ncbi:sugar transporter SWEET1 [Zootermopsis nevadensis]|uniref:Sugar transporter SWEET1 n=1 Tax=Zootermopsis nevadensis TaxID=136037 RepID=A0A067RAA7_ZOONE|nr:sugar transporter SWEET1 [Zootermopsis nevadensis]KDR15496.1 RAG1-activating protein 1-like protein [Zootermopsis nevadensis]